VADRSPLIGLGLFIAGIFAGFAVCLGSPLTWGWSRADNGAWVTRPDADTRCTSSCIDECAAPPVVTCVRLPPPGLPEPEIPAPQ